MARITKAQREQQVRRQKILMIAAAAALFLLGIWMLGLLPNQKGKAVNLSEEVLSYKDLVEKTCKEYEIAAFSQVILAIMQQESGGKVADVMQCSESPYNTLYAQSPNSITDPEYSIRVGIETFAYCLQEAGCSSPRQRRLLKLAIQQYNYGNNYAEWALEKDNRYTLENAQEFSDMMKVKLGWSAYGDPEYVPHVLRYYKMGW